MRGERVVKAGFDEPEQVAGRARTGQGARHDVEDPMAGGGMGERREDEEMMKKGFKDQRFQRFLEEYF